MWDWVQLLPYKVQWRVSMPVDLITIKVANILTDKIPVSLVRFSLIEFNPGTEGYVAWRKEPYSFLVVFAK
jgi:hypothetical protein